MKVLHVVLMDMRKHGTTLIEKNVVILRIRDSNCVFVLDRAAVVKLDFYTHSDNSLLMEE